LEMWRMPGCYHSFAVQLWYIAIRLKYHEYVIRAGKLITYHSRLVFGRYPVGISSRLQVICDFIQFLQLNDRVVLWIRSYHHLQSLYLLTMHGHPLISVISM
jgi:hypothetical protein